MSGPTLVLVVAIGWFAIGLVLSLVMGRRGHDSFSWLVLGTLLGPLALALALDSWRHDEQLHPRIVADAERGPAGVDVLVGVDGSTQSRRALARVAALFGPRIGRLTLASVVPFEATRDAIAEATKHLEQAKKVVPGYAHLAPKLEIVEGHPATALRSLAVRDGYDLIAIGTRGTEMSKRLVGSAAAELARATDVPVLLVDDEPRPAGSDEHEPMSVHEAANAIAVTAWAERARSI